MEQKQPLEQMVFGDLDSFVQKNETRLPTYAIQKINSRWIKDLNISCNTIKVLEENIGRKISDIPCSNVLTDTSPKACDKKERINKWDFTNFIILVKKRKHHEDLVLPVTSVIVLIFFLISYKLCLVTRELGVSMCV